MKKLIRQIMIYLSLGIGVGIMGLLLIPTGALVMLVSMVWKTTNGVVHMLESKYL